MPDIPFNPAQIIAQKRDGGALGAEQISQFIAQYTLGDIPDYQMSALAMAVYLRGMEPAETASLTEAMLRSGTTLQWSSNVPVVDKHSTGGVGDKVSLVLAPLLACCGLRVPMISGRGLGPTGGTLDKLESITGFRTDLSTREIQDVTEKVGCVISGATKDIAPADKKLYALRDVTATVASIPLITASIMSKKLAEGLDALVLDVKFGSGAFMKSLEDARELACSLVETGNRMNVKTRALLTDMNQPLGRMIGNTLEVEESIAMLAGNGPEDLVTLVVELAVELLLLSGRSSSRHEAQDLLRGHIESGQGMEKFSEMVAAQGGDLNAKRPIAPSTDVTASRSGFVSSIDTEKLGQVVIRLGGGRRIATDSIDHSVGLEILVRCGDKVTTGEPLIRVFAQPDTAEVVTSTLRDAMMISDDRPAESRLIVETVAN